MKSIRKVILDVKKQFATSAFNFDNIQNIPNPDANISFTLTINHF